MEHRWDDLRGAPETEKEGVSFLGGCGDADLWCTSNNVLICQYQHSDDYVSYYPPWAMLRRLQRVPRKSENIGVQLSDIPEGEFIYWGNTTGHGHEETLEIARYVAIFAPDLFSQADRETILGFTLKPKNRKKGEQNDQTDE